jgi:hypothetical protein
MKRNEQMKEMREGRVKRHEERKRNTQICYKKDERRRVRGLRRLDEEEGVNML